MLPGPSQLLPLFFIEGYADIARPLHGLTEIHSCFKWTKECQQAFNNLRERLISAPILAFPDCSKPFILDTDARVLRQYYHKMMIQDE